MNNSTFKNVIVVLAIVVVLGLAYIVMRPDQRTTSDKIGDAIHELPNGLGKATHELDSDRTPGEKIGDSVRDAGDKIKENSSSK